MNGRQIDEIPNNKQAKLQNMNIDHQTVGKQVDKTADKTAEKTKKKKRKKTAKRRETAEKNKICLVQETTEASEHDSKARQGKAKPNHTRAKAEANQRNAG